jgi:predicted helicase
LLPQYAEPPVRHHHHKYDTLLRLHLHLQSTERPRVADAGDASTTPPSELYRVAKMKIPKVKGTPDLSTIVYNNRVTLTNIPEEAYRYQLGARSAVEWIIDRYQVKVDKASEIVNDPNDWSDDPRYIIDLLKRIVTCQPGDDEDRGRSP